LTKADRKQGDAIDTIGEISNNIQIKNRRGKLSTTKAIDQKAPTNWVADQRKRKIKENACIRKRTL